MEDLILIRYGELSTKGKNRRYFIDKLEGNIKKKLKAYPNIKIKSQRDRMYIFFDEYNVEEILSNLKNVFGIQSFSLAKKVDSDYQVIEDTVMKIIDFKKYETFKVITKRGDKSFSMISDEVNRAIATRILKETDLKVKMKEYDLAINIDIRYKYSYIFFDKIEGAQGYPVGVSGKGLLMLSGGIDSPVAGYMVMKRGVSVEAIHFASPPYTSAKALNKVLKLASKYLEYTDQVVVHNVPFTKMQLEINKHVDENYSMTILRRMMYRISEMIAKDRNCEVLVNGESIAQVASQTLTSMAVINEVTSMPIIRPLACFDKLDIIEIAKKIDTYETSILPYEDCCTIFLPPNPVINPKIDKAINNEERFDFEKLLQECFEETERIVINAKTYHKVLNIEEDVF
ncbi:thiamine biosynthesis protein ThiI [Bacilli bacterium PM5-3]|nr:thiamine biosynthesis protein ThiI [Bacilli bacterium PM5-3]MDH6603859.1 thiamine biosynthesis protein ThiI [Bacilli bacterium PM5-9]